MHKHACNHMYIATCMHTLLLSCMCIHAQLYTYIHTYMDSRIHTSSISTHKHNACIYECVPWDWVFRSPTYLTKRKGWHEWTNECMRQRQRDRDREGNGKGGDSSYLPPNPLFLCMNVFMYVCMYVCMNRQPLSLHLSHSYNMYQYVLWVCSLSISLL